MIVRLGEPFSWENLSPHPIIGVDEVGRGCLAGPVYAAAVILQNPGKFKNHYKDSKTLSASRREELALEIESHHLVGLGFATVEEIDQHNILQATFIAMKRALARLQVKAGHVIVDGSQKIPTLKNLQQTCLIKGDQRALPVAAASILAKVHRDKLMCELDQAMPEYGFAQHKGYGTEEHRAAIIKFGPSLIHRRTFSGVKEYVSHPNSGATL